MSKRFKTGELVDAYRIEGFLGAGGMGEVYLGLHTGLERYAAVKVLNMSALNSSLSIRFQNEARLQSSLHHPNIATLYDFKELDERLFIFMEYVDGESLDDLIERRFFSVDEALLVFYSIVKAVEFVHSSGVIHRDIKSQNIKLTSEGVPKLLDFGIAKDAESSKLTRTGGVIGTPNYIAPEQLSGTTASVTTDIWALGILLYEMLVGEMPFQSENIGELCDKIRNGQFTPIKTRNPAVPPAVATIAERCLEKDPFKRYQNTEELAVDISRALRNIYGMPANSISSLKELFDSLEDSENDYALAKHRQINRKNSNNFKFWVAGLAGIFITCIIFGLVGIWTFNSSDKSNDIVIVEQTPIPNNSTNIILPTIKKDTSPKNIKPNIQSASSDLSQRTVTIEVIESSADVIRDGQILGKTPYELTAKNGETIALVLRREGYQDMKIQVDINSRKKVYTYSLQSK